MNGLYTPLNFIKRDTLTDCIDAICIELEPLPLDKLAKVAWSLQQERQRLPKKSNPTYKYMLAKVTVNFIRHQLTPYNHWMRQVANIERGGQDAALLIREKLYNAIAYQYPELRKECVKQMNTRTH